jgi:hypothetical protein
MPMKVHPSHAGEVTAAQTGHAAAKLASTNSGSGFATVLASTTDTTKAESSIKLNKGESMSPVSGHAYAEVHGGKRDGMFVNTTDNKRRGQAFVLVHKHGREYHIYGTGKDRVVVALRKPAEKKTDTVNTTSSSGSTSTTTSTGGLGQSTPTVSAS